MCTSAVRLIEAMQGDSYTVALLDWLCEVRLARHAVDVCIILFICVVACFRTFPRFASFINRVAYSVTSQRCLPRVSVDCLYSSLVTYIADNRQESILQDRQLLNDRTFHNISAI